MLTAAKTGVEQRLKAAGNAGFSLSIAELQPGYCWVSRGRLAAAVALFCFALPTPLRGAGRTRGRVALFFVILEGARAFLLARATPLRGAGRTRGRVALFFVILNARAALRPHRGLGIQRKECRRLKTFSRLRRLLCWIPALRRAKKRARVRMTAGGVRHPGEGRDPRQIFAYEIEIFVSVLPRIHLATCFTLFELCRGSRPSPG